MEGPTVSCFLEFANPYRDTTLFRETLQSLRNQTYPLHEIFVCDDAPPEDRGEIAALCSEFNAIHVEYPFRNWGLANGGMYNDCYRASTGEVLLVLCSGFILGARWLEEMLKTLMAKGPGNLVGTDFNWINREFPHPFDSQPDPYQTLRNDNYDHAKTILFREDWIDYDIEFDAVGFDGLTGNQHGQVWWGKQHQHAGHSLWLRRNMDMRHPRRPQLEEFSRHVMDRFFWSHEILVEKEGLPPSLDVA